MAAILCNGISELCTGTCKLIGLPCKVCGVGCNKIPKLLCMNPLSLYIGTVLVAQTPPLIFGLLRIYDLINDYTKNDSRFKVGMIGGCHSGSYWLLAGSIFSVINIAAAFYLGIRVANVDDPAVQHLQSSFKRVCYFLCRDRWIAFYIVILIAYFIWLCLGMNRKLVLGYLTDFNKRSCYNYSDFKYYNMKSSVIDVIGFSWFFLVGGSFALIFSMCCTCCDRRDYSSGSTTNTPTATQPPTATVNNNNINNSSYASTPHDVETPLPPSPYAYVKKKEEEPAPDTYSTQGVPVHSGLEHDIPVAHAEAIPLPTTKTTNSKSVNASQDYPTAAAAAAAIPTYPAPSAPPSGFEYASNLGGKEDEYAAAAAKLEATMAEDKKPSPIALVGKSFGMLLFGSNESRQHKFEQQGENASKAVGKGLSMAKMFVNSKLNKNNNKHDMI